MKSFSCRILALTMVLLSGFAAEAKMGRGRVSVAILAVRSSPKIDNKNLVCNLENATELDIIEISKDGRWYKVDLRSQKNCGTYNFAWVRAEPFFENIGSTAAGFIDNKTGVNIRSTPSTANAPICRLSNNTPVSIVGPYEEDRAWLKVNLKDTKDCKADFGFVSREYIREIQPLALIEGAENSTDEEGYDPVAKTDNAETVAGVCVDCNKEVPDGVEQANASVGEVTDNFVTNYSESAQVKKMIATAMRNKRLRSTNKCFRYVKKALLEAKLTDQYLPGVSAKAAGPTLEKQGFVNLLKQKIWSAKIKSPYDAPMGSVLVYDGGKYGHIEIKTKGPGQNGFVSDYFRESARTGDPEEGRSGVGRTLIGVYINPGVGA